MRVLSGTVTSGVTGRSSNPFSGALKYSSAYVTSAATPFGPAGTNVGPAFAFEDQWGTGTGIDYNDDFVRIDAQPLASGLRLVGKPKTIEVTRPAAGTATGTTTVSDSTGARQAIVTRTVTGLKGAKSPAGITATATNGAGLSTVTVTVGSVATLPAGVYSVKVETTTPGNVKPMELAIDVK